jgi:hypothetical protein
MVASKCSWNYVISENYKAVQSFKLHFFEMVLLCNYTLLPVTVGSVGSIPESHFTKAFSAFNNDSSITNVLSLQC